MEELQDAIEDAQYVNAIASAEDGPRPVLTWEIPTEEQLSEWKAKVHSESKEGSPKPFEFEWTLSHALGFFLFSAFLKEVKNDYVEINFIEEVIRWKLLHGRYRAQKTAYILCNYLTPLPVKVTTTRTTISTTTDSIIPSQESSPEGTVGGDANGNGDDASQNAHCHPNANKCDLPPKTEINEVDLAVEPLPFSVEEVEELKANNRDPTYIKNCIGVDGTVLEKVLRAAAKLKSHPMYRQLSSSDLNLVEKYAKNEENRKDGNSSDPEEQHRLRGISIISNELPDDLFDEVEAIVLDVIKSKHWEEFLTSPHYEKLINFLWFQDRKVVEEDFFVMRVLGRGGFGLVTACKKGTSGKLYAMKVMNKKRIKIKKAEQLTLNEQKCLADINSPFVVNLKYSFQSSVDVFLILDLMTGGDLSYHLSQKGRFPQNECLYYAARIMLGLQALHDKGYVYRDLKPENCLLGEDGRVKLTDLGLATKVTPSLHGAAGTRGYWAPEMLRRDKNGKRMNYDHMVDWFSFGCCLAEFISGTNPFRSEAALNFGLGRGKKTKEKAIDCATLEMNPEFKREKYSEEAEDICRRLLDKDKDTRLGANGCTEIMKHPWFSEVNWEEIMSDKKQPPFLPPKDVNAASQSEIGTFAEDKTFHETVLDEKDEAVYKDWDFTNTKAFAAEVIEFLIYERETGEPLLPMPNDTSCCCAIL